MIHRYLGPVYDISPFSLKPSMILFIIDIFETVPMLVRYGLIVSVESISVL